MSTPLLAGVHPSKSISTCSCTSPTCRTPSTCTSPCVSDCSTLLRSLWSDLSSDVCAVSSSITSWLSSWTSSSSPCCGLSCQTVTVTHPHRLTMDDYFHWVRHHRHTWLHSIPRPQHQRRRGTYLLHDDESDDEDDQQQQDEREETLVRSYQDYTRNMEQQRQAYVPRTCSCQHQACENTTCRNTTLMVAACAGLYERASLRHHEFVAPRHLGVATDDVVVVPPITPLPSTSSTCDSSEFLSVPSSPHLSSQWYDDDSDVDMTRSSSPIPSPLSYPTGIDSDDNVSMDMVDSESESEQELELVDGDIDPDMHNKSSSKSSALRRRSSTQAWLPGMARSTSLQRLALDTPSTTSPMTSSGPKTRRLDSSTSPPTPKDVMDQLWSIQDATQLESIKQTFRNMHISANRECTV